MDVHIDNQVLSGLGTPLLVHLFVPDTVMAELCPNRVPNCEGAWCQTLFSDRTGLTRVCRVFAARGMLPGRPSHRGTFTSVPVYCEEGLPELYNPFHVAALRFYDEGGLVGELQIYYLSLFEGAKRALTDGHLIREASGVQESAAAMQPIPIDPGPPGGAGIEHMPVAAAQVEHPKTYDLKQILLEITQEENRGEQRLGHAGSPALCLGLRLRAGAETKAAAETSVSKHHPALENPSNIRGSAGGEGGGGRAGTGGTVGVGSGAPSRVPVSFSKTRRAIRESRALVRGIAHIFSPHALYVVTYPELSAQGRLHRMTAVTHASPATDLAEVSILGAPEREFRFLISVALRISASFREKLAMQAWTAQQEIPVVIPTSYSRIYKNSDLIREAFFTVQTRVSWESCWVKAISNAPKTPDACLWIDSHPLYEEGASAWGKVIDSRSPGGLVGAASQLVALGTDGHCVHLATTSDGQAFLVLPGGFVIKGQLALTPEERGYILARHGIRREQ
uniref:BGLF1 n=1 Tax=Epstein-Barr virus (strain GD1) TaxID=10376 RepID=A0A385JAU6_EBVG|nr:BGLF1 [human gammaherpesvirus 4]AXY93533.1 BGLF1 [human gammaherpesvirus 4]QAC38570.1 BGLF1 [human gammaherpesvirus 4]QAM89319.1 BGLF1 [human gammaherpesvirus 4]QAN27073.1 BGLF1 [human gammaherpesvirus 4]